MGLKIIKTCVPEYPVKRAVLVNGKGFERPTPKCEVPGPGSVPEECPKVAGWLEGEWTKLFKVKWNRWGSSSVSSNPKSCLSLAQFPTRAGPAGNIVREVSFRIQLQQVCRDVAKRIAVRAQQIRTECVLVHKKVLEPAS